VKLVARSEALAQGLLRYFTGKPCGRGHVAERSTSNRGCLQCHADDMFIRQTNNPQHARVLDARSRNRRPWDSQRPLKENRTEEEWRRQLDYMSAKNQERRDYSAGELSPGIRKELHDKQNGLCNGCGCELKIRIWIISFRFHAEEQIRTTMCSYCAPLATYPKDRKRWRNGNDIKANARIRL
jgi:hypothetical protein